MEHGQRFTFNTPKCSHCALDINMCSPHHPHLIYFYFCSIFDVKSHQPLCDSMYFISFETERMLPTQIDKQNQTGCFRTWSQTWKVFKCTVFVVAKSDSQKKNRMAIRFSEYSLLTRRNAPVLLWCCIGSGTLCADLHRFQYSAQAQRKIVSARQWYGEYAQCEVWWQIRSMFIFTPKIYTFH